MLDRHLKYILRSLTVWWAGALFPSSYIYIDQTVKLYVITAQISHLNRQCCFWKKCHQKFTNCIFIGLISLATPSSHRVGYSLQQSTSFKWQNNFQLQSKGSIQGRDFNINLGPVNNFTCVANGAIPSDDKYYSCYNGNAHMIKCQQNWLFDLAYYGCNYPEITDCGNRTRPEGCV